MWPQDTVEEFEGSIIQHGSHNNRIYLMKKGEGSPDSLPVNLISLAKEKGYTKIFAKVPEGDIIQFVENGYGSEAAVPNFCNGEKGALFLAYYLDDGRREEKKIERIDTILATARSKSLMLNKTSSPELEYRVVNCTKEDVGKIANVYAESFTSYPFPIDNPNYILKSMEEGRAYFGIEIKQQLVALSSAIVDTEMSNVEMSAFATLPDWREHEFWSKLLAHMENKMKKGGIKTTYGMAKALSQKTNITYTGSGYAYGGRLRNNANIGGKISSLNVWYKVL